MTGPARPVLVEVELRRVRLPLVQPFVTAHGIEHEREVVLVRVESEDGSLGWGECPTLTHPTYTAEYTAGAWAILRDELAPAQLAGRRGHLLGHPMAKGALSDAYLDLLDRVRARRPAAGSERVPTVETVLSRAVVGSGRSIDELLARVAADLDAGHRSVKLKIDGQGFDDQELLPAVRSAWPELDLAVDANGSYAGENERVPALDRFELAYIEQPLPADDLVPTAAIARSMHTPIALDESITSLGTLESAAALGALRVVNVKPARVGGRAPAGSIVRLARELGLDAFVGGMLETGIGRAAALAVAVAAEPGCGLPTDLGPSSRYFAEDITDPFELNPDGALTVPDGPGIGVVPDPDRLEAATVERIVLRR